MFCQDGGMLVMNMRSFAVAVTIVAGTATIYSVISSQPSPEPSPEPKPVAKVEATTEVKADDQDSQGGGGAFAAGQPERSRFAEWYSERRSELMMAGMEPGTCGFHLLRPQEDSLWYGTYTVYTSGGRAWWPGAKAIYVANYSLDLIAEEYPNVSFQKPFSGGIVDFTVVAQGTGQFRIDAHFDARAIQVLEAILGTVNSTTDYVDWFLIERSAGELPTDMRAVIVAENKAYLPISLLDIVTGVAGPTVTIAKDLGEAEALDLVVKLEAS